MTCADTARTVQLAKAGFFFDPFDGSPDSVECFLCSKSLAGWEQDDDPVMEHLKHAPDCGWAVMAAIETDLGDYGKLHPLDPGMIDARKATFAGRWPYESKKGFKCKTKQVGRVCPFHSPCTRLTLSACRGRLEIHTDSRVRRHGNMRLLPSGPRRMGVGR